VRFEDYSVEIARVAALSRFHRRWTRTPGASQQRSATTIEDPQICRFEEGEVGRRSAPEHIANSFDVRRPSVDPGKPTI